MDSGTYFVGRAELLNWINSTLDLNLTKVEQTANGAVACQLIDALHPGNIALSKVNFNASTDYEMINNYKVLQNAFNKLNITKAVDVNKLIKAKPLDNIEFMQWFFSYFQKVTAGQGVPDYDAAGRRSGVKGSGARRLAPQSTGGVSSRTLANGSGSHRASMKETTSGAAPEVKLLHKSASGASPGGAENAHLQHKVEELEKEVEVLRQSENDVKQERDFYFSKLREIELMCQTVGIKENWSIMQSVEAVLYAATEEDGTTAREEAIKQYAPEGN